MLKDILEQYERGPVVDQCVDVLNAEVASKKGLSGLAVKGGFKVIAAVKPGFIRAVIDGLLDDFVEELEPFYADWSSGGRGDFGSYLVSNSAEVADGLLGVTDRRAEGTEHGTAKKAYLKLRPSAVEHVSASLPRVGALMNSYLEG